MSVPASTILEIDAQEGPVDKARAEQIVRQVTRLFIADRCRSIMWMYDVPKQNPSWWDKLWTDKWGEASKPTVDEAAKQLECLGYFTKVNWNWTGKTVLLTVSPYSKHYLD